MYRTLHEIRFLPAVTLGGAVSFALFLMMHQLIATNHRSVESSSPPAGLGLVKVRREPPIVRPRPHPPTRPTTVTRPRTGLHTPDSNPTMMRTPLPPDLNFNPRTTGPGIWNPPAQPRGAVQADNASLMLKFAVKPLYPPDAEYEGIEGTVRTCFTVAPDGSVVDPRVVGASSPQARRVFGPYALRTVMQWKYFPRKVDGAGVATPNVCGTIQFTLHSAAGGS